MEEVKGRHYLDWDFFDSKDPIRIGMVGKPTAYFVSLSPNIAPPSSFSQNSSP